MNVSSLNKDCCYRNLCLEKNENCENNCILYQEMNFLLNNCGIDYSEDRVSFSLEENKLSKEFFDVRENIFHFVSTGGNMFITSTERNNRKTRNSIRLMYRYFDAVAIGNSFQQRGYFIYVPEFVQRIRTFEYRETDEFKRIDGIIKNVDLVIWDDITGIKLNSTDQNNLYSYLGYRKNKRKANIYNGVFQGDLSKILGEKIEEILMEESIVVELDNNIEEE